MGKISEHMKLWSEFGMIPVVDEYNNLRELSTRGTLQEFIEWAQGNYRGKHFIVVTDRLQDAMDALQGSGYGYRTRTLQVTLGVDVTNDYWVVQPSELERISGMPLSGIYFMDEPNEREWASGVSRLLVNGAKAWIAHPQQELTTLNVAWKFE